MKARWDERQGKQSPAISIIDRTSYDFTAEIHGRAYLTSSGEGLKSAKVLVLTLTDAETRKELPFKVKDELMKTFDGSTMTDDSGNYRVFVRMQSAFINKAAITIAASITDNKSIFFFGSARETIQGERTELNIPVGQSGSISGRISDEKDRGVEGIAVALLPWFAKIDDAFHKKMLQRTEDYKMRVISDPDGRFDFGSLYAGVYFIEVGLNQKGFLFRRHGGNYDEFGQPIFLTTSRHRAQIALINGGVEINFLAVSEPRQKVIVTDGAGRPVAAAKCMMHAMRPTAGGTVMFSREAFTDSEGKADLPFSEEPVEGWLFRILVIARGFEFNILSPWSRHELKICKSGYKIIDEKALKETYGAGETVGPVIMSDE